MEEVRGKDGVDRFPSLPGDKEGESSLVPPEGLSFCTCPAVRRQVPRPHDKAGESPEQAQTPM